MAAVSTWTAQRSRPLAVLAAAGGSALLLLAGGRTWATGTVTGPGGPAHVGVGGREAAPAVLALALVAAAATVALLTAGRRTRLLLGAVLLLAGVAASALAASTAADPAAQLPAAASRVTGVSRPAVSGARSSGWPWVGAAAGLAIAAGGAVTLLRGPGWPAPARRYAGPGEQRRPGDWEALSRGEDPTA